ncbi:MAG TPA: hypothetical protein VKG26_09515 [Bacteroidia bacterium]|nr:hypothetical protein [Bacteroidia bacterium]
MTDDSNKVIEALKQENTALKGIIDQISAQKDALSGTVNDILQANVNLKAGNILFQKKVTTLEQEVNKLKAELNKAESPVTAD